MSVARRQGSEAPRLPEVAYGLLFEHTLDGIVLLQQTVAGNLDEPGDYRVLRANGAFCRITGMAAPELEHRPLPAILGDLFELRRACDRALQGTKPARVVLQVARLDRHLEVTLLRLSATLCAAVLRDTTEQVLAEQPLARANRDLRESNRRLEQKQRELEEFVSTASHDLKSPLIAIQGFARLLGDRLRERLHDREVDYFHRIASNVRQMETRLNALLMLARTGPLATATEPIDTDALIDEILLDFSVRAEAKGVRLLRAGSLPAICGSLLGIREVFENLIDNAIKYMPPRPAARVEVGYDPAVAAPTGAPGAYYVRDNGAGVAPEDCERIFEMFHRGPHPAGSHDGSGLGLVIVRRVVESHRGSVWVEASPGQGATFFFTLPAASERVADELVEQVKR